MNSGQTQVLVVIIEISCSGKGKSDQWVMKKPDYMYPMRDRDTLIGTACVCVGGGPKNSLFTVAHFTWMWLDSITLSSRVKL